MFDAIRELLDGSTPCHECGRLLEGRAVIDAQTDAPYCSDRCCDIARYEQFARLGTGRGLTARRPT